MVHGCVARTIVIDTTTIGFPTGSICGHNHRALHGQSIPWKASGVITMMTKWKR
jgi:hypothetical protein